jgi:hypothetical protein
MNDSICMVCEGKHQRWCCRIWNAARIAEKIRISVWIRDHYGYAREISEHLLLELEREVTT